MGSATPLTPVRLEAQGATDGTGCLLVDTADDSPAADLILNVSTCLVEVDIPLQIGWNHISLPLDPLTPYTAEGVCIEIISQGGDVAEIDRWYASGWDGHICGLPFNDFDVEIGKGYFVKSASACTVTPSLAALSGRWRMEVGDWRMENGGWRLDFQHPTSITEVKVTNLRDTSFTVSWSTDAIATGWVNYGTSPTLGQTAYDDRGAKAIGHSHHVTLQGLSPETTYYFEVVSGATVNDRKGSGYQVTTGRTLELPASDSIYGQVFESDGVTPAEGAIVYVTLRDADGVGSPGEAGVMSALVDADGWWQSNLGNARLADGTGYFTYSAAGDAVVLLAQGADGGFVSQMVDTGDLGSAVLLTLVRPRRPYLPLVVKE
jgi:hypothetical protein